MSDKSHISLVVCGHVDAGKSTTTGHLIFKLGGIAQREMDKLQSEADQQGKSSFAFAYYMEKDKAERERDEAMKYAMSMNHPKPQQKTYEQPEQEEDYLAGIGIDADSLAEGKHLKAVLKEVKDLKKELNHYFILLPYARQLILK